MTAKQKANRERFKKVVAEAAKLRKKNPKLTQAQAVKQAWAISYGKKRKVGYKADRLSVVRNATPKIKKYKDKGYSRSESIRNANIDAAYMSGKKPTGTKVKAKKGKRTSEMHTDTKSHNVNIRVISGIENDKLIRKQSSKFLKMTGHTQLSKDVLKDYIPMTNVIKAVDFAIKEQFSRVENGNYSKQLKEKAKKTKAVWETFKKAYLK